ncbi:mannitol dehydrogenase family protein [Desulfogranum japonicum]|uniref:mannitol dehydrogenase family protein n=1 Tax=Desulfogranum japonicum TaxID=231447 RepID=UPI0004091903|nr:mannitol dehydrogenase family protein [Desulfogranum japonicum]
MDRLKDTIDIPANVQVPGYQREQHGIGIVHFGLGAFHRGHMAVYTDDVLADKGGDWSIVGVSLRSPGARDRLLPQHCLYTLVERGVEGEKHRIIGSVKNVLVAPENPEAVLQQLCDPKVHIISFTITEKGYLRDAATGELLRGHPDIQHDLVHPEQPRTMHGFITEALARRKQAGFAPVTLLCCDNLPENGVSLRKAVCGFARLRDQKLADWIEASIAFPCTMVDRIVPATTASDIEQTSLALGRYDAAPVICEPFCQWVIENNFSSPRPVWEAFGATLVQDVAPYEDMKLRLLNCSHSAMAYLGYLSGIETIDQVIITPVFKNFVVQLMQEVLPTLDMPEGVDLQEYCAALIERFRNPSLKHRTWQIAMDGSQKIPQRILSTIRALKAAGKPYTCLAMSVAGWLRYVTAIDEHGNSIEVSDPMAEQLCRIAEQNKDNLQNYVQEIVKMADIFGPDLASDAAFQDTIHNCLQTIYDLGAQGAVGSLL